MTNRIDAQAEIQRLQGIIVSQEEELARLRAQVIAMRDGIPKVLRRALDLSESPSLMLREIQRFADGR